MKLRLIFQAKPAFDLENEAQLHQDLRIRVVGEVRRVPPATQNTFNRVGLRQSCEK